MVVLKWSRRLLLPLLPCLLLIAALGGSLTTSQVSAQSATSDWSTPVMLFESSRSAQAGERGGVEEPVVISDTSGMVHVFWTSEVDTTRLLYYSRWDGKAWTAPVDVEAMPGLSGPSAAVDTRGNIHLVWSDGGQKIYYSSAPVREALTAARWSRPRYLADTPPKGHGQIVADSSGRLHIAYPEQGPRSSFAVKYITSVDGGKTWSFAITVADMSYGKTAPEFVRLAVSDGGMLHVVWTEFQLPNAWPPVGVYYARSLDGGKSWSSPLEVAGQDNTQINVATQGNTVVHLAWNGDAKLRGRYHKASLDAGNSWSETETVFDSNTGSGSTGSPALSLDSGGVLHLVTNLVRARNNGRYDVTTYTSWDGQKWGQAVDVSRRVPNVPESDVAASNPEGLDNEFNEYSFMTIGEGNRLHVVFFQDEKRLWYMTREVSAPHVSPMPFVPLLENEPAPEVARPLTPTPTLAPASQRVAVASTTEANIAEDTRRGLALGVSAAALLVGAVTGLKLIRRGLRA